MKHVRHELNIALIQADRPRAEIARSLGIHKAQITRLLNGTGNMTFESFSNLAFALGKKPQMRLLDIDRMEGNENSLWNSVNGKGIKRLRTDAKIRDEGCLI